MNLFFEEIVTYELFRNIEKLQQEYRNPYFDKVLNSTSIRARILVLVYCTVYTTAIILIIGSNYWQLICKPAMHCNHVIVRFTILKLNV